MPFLFPPAIFFEQVHSAVAIHVANSQSVVISSVDLVGGNCAKLPLLPGIVVRSATHLSEALRARELR